MDAQTPPSFDADDYRSIRALAAYIDRVGAEQLNFRRFMVKEHRGNYYTERAIIHLQPDGTVEAPEQYAPTEAEADAIRIALRDIEWPQPIGAGGIDELRRKSGAGLDRLFVCWDSSRTEIRMVQERVEFADGGKAYLPWTFFSDGVWRRMEPDGPLPFWKPALGSARNKIMVHEGAKAARHCDALANDASRIEELRAHPWGEELKHYEHWGMIGGALAPHRADFSEVRRHGPAGVVYVCDNDEPGLSVIKTFSRALSSVNAEVLALRFDDSFPYSFDLADKFPAALYREVQGKKVYAGPLFRDCIKPATWATRIVPPLAPVGPGRPPRPTHTLRDIFLRNVFVVAGELKPLFVFRFDRSRVFSEEGANTFIRTYSDVPHTMDMLKSQSYEAIDDLSYVPGENRTIILKGSKRTVNTWVGPNLQPIDGDPEPWENYLRHLIPDPKECEHFKKWLATLIARPDIRMIYGIVLSSLAQGTGKNTLCVILKRLLGYWNVAMPSGEEISNRAYNSYLAHKRLVFVSEIYAGHSWSAYNKLKDKVTDETVRVEEKFIPSYEIEAWAHFIICSNSSVPIAMEEKDRRWFMPTVTEATELPGGWDTLYDWIAAEGAGIILKWARDYVEKNGHVKVSDKPEMTDRKRQLIDESKPTGQALVADLVDAGRDWAARNHRQFLLVDADVSAWLCRSVPEGEQKSIKPSRIRNWLTAAGMVEVRGRWRVKGHTLKMKCCASTVDLAANIASSDDVSIWRQKPEELEGF